MKISRVSSVNCAVINQPLKLDLEIFYFLNRARPAYIVDKIGVGLRPLTIKPIVWLRLILELSIPCWPVGLMLVKNAPIITPRGRHGVKNERTVGGTLWIQKKKV